MEEAHKEKITLGPVEKTLSVLRKEIRKQKLLINELEKSVSELEVLYEHLEDKL